MVLSRAEELFGSDASVGVVGLGAGTLACYQRPGQTWRFFEIDPLVVDIAQRSGAFHFLEDCAPNTEITVGDARLELQKVPADAYDVLAVDAFSSDSIPMHLMTEEAFDLYDRVVREDGLLLVHITNRFMDLEPVLLALTTHAGWSAQVREDVPDLETDQAHVLAPSTWVALSRSAQVLDMRLDEVGGRWRAVSEDHGPQLWTDDHASVLPLLR
jgi:spermidine synthase